MRETGGGWWSAAPGIAVLDLSFVDSCLLKLRADPEASCPSHISVRTSHVDQKEHSLFNSHPPYNLMLIAGEQLA